MKTSPLQLVRYVVSDIQCTANPGYSSDAEMEHLADQFEVRTNINRLDGSEDPSVHHWSVEMTIMQQVGPKQNFPYSFKLSLLGIFECRQTEKGPRDEDQFVRVNGSSILYGAAREVVRSLTSVGCWGDLILPTVSFYDPKPVRIEPNDSKTGADVQ
jgi:preprotein translocase subunit SecB